MSPEDERAALDAVERVGRDLRGILAWFRVPPEDAEELHQEALLALVRCWDRIDRPEGWLIGTIFRLCRKYHSKRRQREWLQSVDGRLLEALAPANAPEQKRFEILLDLDAVLCRLRERERAILILRTQGLSCDEVARHLGCQASSIGKMTSRALAEARLVARRLKAFPKPAPVPDGPNQEVPTPRREVKRAVVT